MWKYAFLVAIRPSVTAVGFGYALEVGTACHRLVSGNRRNVIGNLRRVMGADAPQRQVEAAARKVFVNVAKYYVDLVRMPHMDLGGFYKRRFRYYGFDEYLLTAVADGKGVIVLSGHMGNPELAVQGMLPRGRRSHYGTTSASGSPASWTAFAPPRGTSSPPSASPA
jgi:lauroyl/myristoyl acyltransferase